MCCFVLFSLSLHSSIGAIWYVDDSAKGSNTGTSWENAWTNLSSMVVSSFMPGDEIQIAAGTYSGPPSLNSSGTSNAPITFRLAQNKAYQGHVYVTNGINIYGDWIRWNGAFDANAVAPMRVMDLDAITNNIGLHITSRASGSHGINLGNGDRTGIDLQWLHVHDVGALTKGFPANGEPGEHALSLSGTPTNILVANCFFENNIYGDTVNGSQDTGVWGNIVIRDSLVHNIGDDAFQMNGSFDIYRCKIKGRTWGYASGHTDVFQTWGGHIRIHHNIIIDVADPTPGASQYNSLSYAQFSTPVQGNFLFYNNLYYTQNLGAMSNAAPGLKLSHDAWWSEGKFNSNVIITNIVLANNLFCNPNAQVYAHTFYYESDASRGTNWSYTITNCAAYNNLFIDSYQLNPAQLGGIGVSFPSQNLSKPAVTVDPNRYVLSGNILSGLNRDTYYMGARNSFDEVRSVFNLPNWTNQPAFRWYSYKSESPQFDFRLATGDTNAINKGVNLSAFETEMPMISVDLDGNPRGIDGAWDIGPYEWTDDLLLHINFDDDDWNKGFMTDVSGNGRHGYEFGHGNQLNWPASSFRTNSDGSVSQAGEFRWHYDATINQYLRSGDYLAVTNIWKGTPQMTVSVWAYFDTSRDANGNPIAWNTGDNQASIISAGYADKKSWELARHGTRPPVFRVFTNDSYAAGVSYRFADTFDANGKSDKWHHYAATFDNGTIILYQDGTPYSTNASPYNPKTLGVVGGWVGIGCKTHGAQSWSTPQFGDDLYPNHGWMNGYIDDVRVYSAALTAAEILKVYRDTQNLPVPNKPVPPGGLRILMN